MVSQTAPSLAASLLQVLHRAAAVPFADIGTAVIGPFEDHLFSLEVRKTDGLAIAVRGDKVGRGLPTFTDSPATAGSRGEAERRHVSYSKSPSFASSSPF